MEVMFPNKNFDEIYNQSSKVLFRLVVPGIFALILLWLASGIYMVGPGEVGIVRQFGTETRKTEAGLRYHLPSPIERVDVVNVERVRRAEIGVRNYDGGGGVSQQRVTEESLMLTGDENIVEAQMIVQYQIKDPSLYLFRINRPEEVLRTSTEVALRSMVGNVSIDEFLTVGRDKVQIETQAFLQRLLDAYETGLRVTEVRLQVVDPPDQVKDAFHEVVRARENREQLINQAKGYSEDVIPKARGQAQQIARAAEAYREERVLRAQGDGARFVALSEEYQKAKQVTRTRLYLETVERVLKPIKKLVIDPTATGGVSALLPISEFRMNDNKSV